jgi:xanthine dehydrogenase accessory factor
MSEWAALARSLRDRRDSGRTAALATVVSTEGSAYRKPGAWMLVDMDGAREGVVSGGCLEADVAERALACLASGNAELAAYDTREADDVVWGLGMGCRGLVRILIEPLAGDRLERAAEFFTRVASAPAEACIAVVLSTGGDRGWRLGDRALLAEPAVELFEGLEVAFIPVIPTTQLVVCGAGEDAVPLARLGVELGWTVLVVDHRPALARGDRFPGARVELLDRVEDLAALLPRPHARIAAVVMTHNLQRDVAWTAALLPLELRYLGLLGPRPRSAQVLAAAQALAEDPRPARGIYAPAGLDIASESPREIAVSIVAEISAVLGGASPGHLRDRAARHSAAVPAPES